MDTDEAPVDHFGDLVDYLSEYPADQREKLADRYGAVSEGPDDIAREWCQEPEGFRETVDGVLRNRAAEDAVRELVYEHDAPVGTDWMGASTMQQLVDAGLLNRLVTSPFYEREVVFPGALAASLADKLEEPRSSLAVLLGREPRESLDELAAEYDLATTGSRIEVILRLMDFFAGPEAVDEIVGRVGNPDWLGPVMMVLELGGVCYWREVFGYDFDRENDEESNIIPLMREEERAEERRIAERLQALGLVYRFDAVDSEFEMVAVPEELWQPIWGMGRDWLWDWTYRAYRGLREMAAGGESWRPEAALQDVGKWLVCEAAAARLEFEDGAIVAEELERLGEASTGLEVDVEVQIETLYELSVLRPGVDGFVMLGAEYQKLLDMERESFVRNVLYEWCGGFVGSAVDSRLPKAFGLDESWREQAVEILRARHEYIPRWMQFEGVPQERTGAGCLRETEENNPELLSKEVGITNGYVWSSKMLFLDLLSVLESGRRVPLGGLVELAQMSASVCLFFRVGQLLEDPRNYFYLPVQRSSLLTEPFHTTEFEGWLVETIETLFEPLGVASLQEDETVWLETEHLRVKSPPGWASEERERLLQQILGREEIEWSEPNLGGPPLEAVEEPEERVGGAETRDRISLERSIDEILGVAEGRPVERFDGEAITFGAPVVGSADSGE